MTGQRRLALAALATATLLAIATGCHGEASGEPDVPASGDAATPNEGTASAAPADSGAKPPPAGPPEPYDVALLVSVRGERLAGETAPEGARLRAEVRAAAAAALEGFATLRPARGDEAALADRMLDATGRRALRRVLAALRPARRQDPDPAPTVVALRLRLPAGAATAERVEARATTRRSAFLSAPASAEVPRPTDLADAVARALWDAFPIAAEVEAVDGTHAKLRLRLPAPLPARAWQPPLALLVEHRDGPRRRPGFVVIEGGSPPTVERPLADGRVVATFGSQPRANDDAVSVRVDAGIRRLEVERAHDGGPAHGIAVFVGPTFDDLAFRGVTAADGTFELAFEKARPIALSLRKTVSTTAVDFGRTVVTVDEDGAPLRLRIRTAEEDISALVDDAEARATALADGRDAVLDGFGHLYDGKLAQAGSAFERAERAVELLEKKGGDPQLASQVDKLREALRLSQKHAEAIELRSLGERQLLALQSADAVKTLERAHAAWPENPKIKESLDDARAIAADGDTETGRTRQHVVRVIADPEAHLRDPGRIDAVIASVERLAGSERLLDRRLLDDLSRAVGSVYDEREAAAAAELQKLDEAAATGVFDEAEVAEMKRVAERARERAAQVLAIRRKIEEAMAD